MCIFVTKQATKPQRGNEKQPGRSPTTFLITTAKVRLFFNPRKKSNSMKKNRISDILGVMCVASVFAGCVVGHDGGVTIWNIICLALAGLFGWLSKKTEESK